MTGPTRADFADAVLTPAAAFADPDLAAADTVLGPGGFPLPYPGDRAVVFQLCGRGGRSWAVKCYPEPDPALTDRYARVAAAVGRGRLPFAVPSRYLQDGVRVGGRNYPAAVLDWVEGVPLDRVVRDRAGDPAAVHELFRAWVTVAAGLRAAGAAHGDLAHHNVLVVSGGNPIRLVDYDSFHLPGLPPAADAGHPNYRHPHGVDPADRDRFPLLVVATALRAVAVLGRPVWDRFDTGDNLLFAAADFADSAGSPLLNLLAGSSDPTLRTLTDALTRACRRPPAETPWLNDLYPGPAPARPATAVEGRARVEPRPHAPLWRQLAVPLALLVGMMMVGLGAAAGVVSALVGPQPETVEVGANPSAPPDGPAEKQPTPRRAPPPKRESPAPMFPPGPPGFHKLWAKPYPGLVGPPDLVLTPGDRFLLARVPGGGRVDVIDPRSGAVLSALRGPGAPSGQFRAWAPAADRLAVFGPPLAGPAAWDPQTGARRPDLDPALPPAARPGGRPAACDLSPDGRFLFTADSGGFAARKGERGLFRLTDAATGRQLRVGIWSVGDARFTADSGRLVMLESNGRGRSISLPQGDTEAEWAYRPVEEGTRVLGLSADGGAAVLFVSPDPDRPAPYLAEGKTGRLLRRLGPEFESGRAGLSADGRHLLGVVSDRRAAGGVTAVLSDARTGAVLVQTSLDLRPGGLDRVAVAADARGFAVFDTARQELAYYGLRGEVPPVPPGTPVPPPVAVAPPRPEFPPLAGRPPAIEVRPVPQIIPPIVRPGLPAAAAVRPRWTAPAAAGVPANAMSQAPHYSPDGRTLVLSGGTDGTVLTFDAATGAAGVVFDGHRGPGGVQWLATFADRVVSGGFDARDATWEARTGRKVDDLRFPELPSMPDGVRGHAGLTRAVSPTGRYTVLARKEAFPAGASGPLRVLDTTTGKEVVAAGWRGASAGNVLFTPDETRLFVLDGLGKATWYKLPSGDQDARWDTGAGLPAEFVRVVTASADGTRMVYNGPLPGAVGGGLSLVDGMTGRVVGRLPLFPHQPAVGCALSPDGRLAAVPVRDPVGLTWHTDLLAVDGWRVLGRITHPAGSEREAAQFRFSPDGKELAVFFRGAKQLAVYPVPGAAAAPPAPALAAAAPPPPAIPERWASLLGPAGGAVLPVRFDPVTRRVVAPRGDGEAVVVLYADTGAPVAARPAGWKWAGGGDLHVLPGGRLGFHAKTDPAVEVWDIKAGKAADAIPLPPMPAGGDGSDRRAVWFSPDGRFAVVSRTGDPAPVRVVELETGNVAAGFEWSPGAVAFTADGGRVLFAAADGRHRWRKLPTGEADGGWEAGPVAAGVLARGLSLSADGRRVGGVQPGTAAPAVLDAATGAAVRVFGPEYVRGVPPAVSSDGLRAAVLRSAGPDGKAGIEVFDLATGRALGRAAVPAMRRQPAFFFAGDGRGLVVHGDDEDKVRWFDLPPRADGAGR